MTKRSKGFDRWRERMGVGVRPVRVWPKVAAAIAGTMVVASFAFGIPWYLTRVPAGQLIVLEPRLELTGERQLTVAASVIDTRRVQRVSANFLRPPGEAKPVPFDLYSSPQPIRGGGVVRLADLDCYGSRPFLSPPLVENRRRYQFMIEAIPFGAAGTKPVRFFAQPNFQEFERREKPLPVWIESPYHGQVVDYSFDVEGQAYEAGFLQLRVRPKRWGRYYLKGRDGAVDGASAIPVKRGQEFKVPVHEGSSEGFELYALFAKNREDLPASEAINSLPYGMSRVDIIGPVDFFLNPLRGPVRTDEQWEEDIELAAKIAARFTTPPQAGTEVPLVKLRDFASGEVSPEAEQMNLRYVLGVRPIYRVKPAPEDPAEFVPAEPGEPPTHHVWIQSDPWSLEKGRFENKPVKFGVDPEEGAFEFELWLIAIQPQAKVRLEKGQAWLASALPEGCVRATSVTVVKLPSPEQDLEAESGVQASTAVETVLPPMQWRSQQRIRGYQRSHQPG